MRRAEMRWILLTAVFLAFASASAAEPNAIRAELQPPEKRQPAPAFRLADAAGKSVQLSDYRGRAVLLDLWATECGGCKLEIPWFMEIAAENKSRGLDVVGVSIDILYEDLKGPAEAWARVTPFVQAHKVNYMILMGDDSITSGYHITALPATYLIDRKGRIAATYVGLVDRKNLEANIRSVLAEP